MVFGHRLRLSSKGVVAWHIQYTLPQALREQRAVKTRVQVFRDGHPDEQAPLGPRPPHIDIERTYVLVERTQKDFTLFAIQARQFRHMPVITPVRQHPLDQPLVQVRRPKVVVSL